LALSKEKKKELVEQYKQLLEQSQGLVMIEFSGLTVKDTEKLRNKIREIDGEFHIVKNTLAKLAFEQAKVPAPEGAFEGTTAIGFTQEDVPPLAKAIAELVNDVETVKMKGGIIEGTLYDPLEIQRIADLPALPVLQAQLLGVLTMPGSQLAGVLAGSVRQLLTVLKAYSEQEVEPAGA
jgi:large subunit ribosomal protein L10